MKKYILLFTVAFVVIQATGQTNTFPVSGNVGIGTTNPLSKLQIVAENNDGIFIGNYNDNLGWDGTGAQPGYHIRFAGYRDILSNYTGAKISALRTNACCNALATGMDLAFYTQQALASLAGDGSLAEDMRIKDNGNVGIGTTNPFSKLNIYQSMRDTIALVLQGNTINTDVLPHWVDLSFDGDYGNGTGNVSKIRSYSNLYSQWGSDLAFLTTGSLGNGTIERMRISKSGNVGIGTTSPTEKLCVNGNIRSQKIIVTQSGWSDYVFDSAYQLQPLTELEIFIKNNKHLPDMPSEKEVEKEGIDLGENQTVLLKKIEELTLYLIEIRKENEKRDQKYKNILEENEQLKQRIEKLENKK